MKIKKIIKNEKGSALILTMIVLVNAILIVTAIGTITFLEQKTNSRTKNSTPALQRADSGLEYILKKMNDDASGVASVRSHCSSFSASTGKCSTGITGVTVYFLQGGVGAHSVITNGSTVSADVTAVRSIGAYGTGQERVTRALEAER